MTGTARRLTVKKLSTYVKERGGLYTVPTREGQFSATEVLTLIPAINADSPCIVVLRDDGQEMLYTHMTFGDGNLVSRGEVRPRKLCMVRVANDLTEWIHRRLDAPYENPYDDPTIEPFITVPKSVAVHGFQYECAVCGRVAFFPGHKGESKERARFMGWRDTRSRGWQCQDHFGTRPKRGRFSTRSLRRRQLEQARATFLEAGQDVPDYMPPLPGHEATPPFADTAASA